MKGIAVPRNTCQPPCRLPCSSRGADTEGGRGCLWRHAQQAAAGRVSTSPWLCGAPPWFPLPAETLPHGLGSSIPLSGKALSSQLRSNLPRVAQPATLPCSQANRHISPAAPLHREVLHETDNTKTSFLSVICSPDTKSALTAASSTSVIETRHCELKVGDRSSATRGAERKKKLNSHLNQQH